MTQIFIQMKIDKKVCKSKTNRVEFEQQVQGHQVEVDVVKEEAKQEGPGDNLDGLLARATFLFGCDDHQARSSDGQLMCRSHWMVANSDSDKA